MYFEYLFTFYIILKNILSTVILKKENSIHPIQIPLKIPSNVYLNQTFPDRVINIR